MEQGMISEQGELIVYQTSDGQANVNVRLLGETVWLTLNQIAELFGRDTSVISRHPIPYLGNQRVEAASGSGILHRQQLAEKGAGEVRTSTRVLRKKQPICSILSSRITRSLMAINGPAPSFFFCFCRAINIDQFLMTRPSLP